MNDFHVLILFFCLGVPLTLLLIMALIVYFWVRVFKDSKKYLDEFKPKR